MKLKLSFVLVAVGLIASQCYYDHEGILYPESANCTPSTLPSYSADVVSLLNGRCNNCHSGSFPSGNIKLDSYNAVSVYVSDGSLIGSIKHTGTFSPMPKNSTKLSACDVEKIQAWVDAGAPDN